MAGFPDDPFGTPFPLDDYSIGPQGRVAPGLPLDEPFIVPDEIIQPAPVVFNDVPTFSGPDGAIVAEDDLRRANGASFNGNDTTPEAVVVTGPLGIDFGADGPGSIIAAAGPSGLTSQGDPVNFTFDPLTQTLTGIAGGREVLTLRFDPDGGTYTLILLDNFDHPDPTGSDSLLLEFTFTATDGNGDPIDAVISAEIIDDVPVRATP